MRYLQKMQALGKRWEEEEEEGKKGRPILALRATPPQTAGSQKWRIKKLKLRHFIPTVLIFGREGRMAMAQSFYYPHEIHAHYAWYVWSCQDSGFFVTLPSRHFVGNNTTSSFWSIIRWKNNKIQNNIKIRRSKSPVYLSRLLELSFNLLQGCLQQPLACPLGFKRHLKREETFKEGNFQFRKWGILGGKF